MFRIRIYFSLFAVYPTNVDDDENVECVCDGVECSGFDCYGPCRDPDYPDYPEYDCTDVSTGKN